MNTVEDIIMSCCVENSASLGSLTTPETSQKTRQEKLLAEVAEVRALQKDVGIKYGIKPKPIVLTPEQKAELDSRSVHVSNVAYGSTAEGLSQHFEACGTINRVTLMPKAFAYIEFEKVDTVSKALQLTNSVFAARIITVTRKRTNTPGMRANATSTQRHHPYQRGGYRGRGAPRGRGF